MSIDSLLELIVERDSEITGRQIAEALWFMLAIKHSQETEADARGQPSAPSPTSVAPSLPSTIQQSEQPLPLIGQEETRSTPTINQPDLPDTVSASEQSQADLYPLNTDASKETAAKITPLRVPSVGALPNAASIARALRPLRRRVPSRHHIRLDEKVTAERSAEENTLVPVMLPAQSRWLALHLVVDQGGSSMIWQDTIQELHRLLIRQGAFRDVRLWQLDSDSDSDSNSDDKELMLFAGRTSTIPRRASELSDPEGRHLILIVSDCVGRAWHDGRATKTLSLWSNSSPMALFQLMPPQLWERTALGREIEVHLKASAAGIPNTRLIATPVDEWEDVLPTKKVLTPVVTLTTEAIKAWVNLLIGRPGSVVSGHAFDRGAKSSHPNRPTDLTPSPSQRVQRFLSLSTPIAQRLALLASAAPVTLPILNLLCATFLPMADQSHVAEVLLGGILHRTSSNRSREPDAVLYEFYDGVRDLLLELAPFNQSSEVVARVSAYLEERAEHEREMRALLALPGDADITNLPEALPFAHIRSILLRGLGYGELAEILEHLIPTSTSHTLPHVATTNVQSDAKELSEQSIVPNTSRQSDADTTQQAASLESQVVAPLHPGDSITIGAIPATTIHVDGRQGEISDNLLGIYYQHVATLLRHMPLHGMAEQRVSADSLVIELDKIYTQLATTATTERERVAGATLASFDAAAFLQAHTGIALLPSERRTMFRAVGTSRGEQQSAEPNHARSVDQFDLEAISVDELSRLSRETTSLTFFGPQLVTEAIAGTPHLVLLGAPGSGKSTALRYLAYILVVAGLYPQIDLNTYLVGWTPGRVLPIFAPLLPLARSLAADPIPKSRVEDLWDYLAADLLQPISTDADLATAILEEVEAGRAILLLDGLDEVAGTEARRKVVQVVQSFAERYPLCRIVVACRVSAYEGERNAQWQLTNWPSVTLADWTIGQMLAFLRTWYYSIAALRDQGSEWINERIASLTQIISGRNDLQRLARQPLMLTVIALVHLNDGRLPEKRAVLYRRCIDILLAQWEIAGKDASEYGSLMDYISLPDADIHSLLPILGRAAFHAHSAAMPSSYGRLSRTDLREIVIRELESLSHPNPVDGANRFLEYIDLRAGLLQASEAGDVYIFTHQIFQEYLAGLELTRGGDFVERVMALRQDDRWRAPILLAVGHLMSEGPLSMPYRLLKELVELQGRDELQRQRDLLQAAEIADDVDWGRLEQGSTAVKQLRHDLFKAMSQLIDGGMVSSLSIAERQRAETLFQRLSDVPFDTSSDSVKALPKRVFLGNLIGIPDTPVETLTERTKLILEQRWQNTAEAARADWLRVPLGVVKDGQLRELRLEGRYDGAHGLIIANTNSDRLELLTTMLVGLTLSYGPESLRLQLVDISGCGIVGRFAELPHVEVQLEQPTAAEAQQFIASLREEMLRRQRVLVETGTKDFVEYRQKGLHQTHAPFPHLLIVVDEYTAIQARIPHMVDGLDTIVRIGRSLGINLFLASKQSTGFSMEVQASVKLRLVHKLNQLDANEKLSQDSNVDYDFSDWPGQWYLKIGDNQIEQLRIASSNNNLHLPGDMSPVPFFAIVTQVIRERNKDQIDPGRGAAEIRVSYDELEHIALRFATREEMVKEGGARLRAQLEALQSGGWIGRGADAFFAEMHDVVFPAWGRLASVLNEIQAVVRELALQMRRAEIVASERTPSSVEDSDDESGSGENGNE